MNRVITVIATLLLTPSLLTTTAGSVAQYKKPTVIAHRGASGYAPEHTMEAYRLALAQNADYVEQDLQITKDGLLICMHDTTLERTTDVEEIYPDRYSTATVNDQPVKVWNVSDFTLAEIKRLDAGSWFNAKFKGSKVPTWQEAIDLVRGKAGLYPETKEPEFYQQRGFDMEKLVVDVLKKNSLFAVNADPKTPVFIQSFSAQSLQRLREKYDSRLPHLLLISDPSSEWLLPTGLNRAKAFADGIGPAKEIVDKRPELIKQAHASGLSVTLYTIRASDLGRFKSLRDEMSYFLTLGVDAMFTDNPDQFPR